LFLNQPVAKKVPALTVFFWIINARSTGIGDTYSDFFFHRYDPYLFVILAAAILAITIIWELSLRRYDPWAYWLAVSMVAVFGTMAAGIVHIYMGIPYVFSATIYALITAVIFVLWYITERTLSVHSIYKRRREIFYWAAVLATFAMGTAVGGMTAFSISASSRPE
jgi:uncharacterized membrane-anchored protein